MILVIDTATSQALLAIGAPAAADGSADGPAADEGHVAVRTWVVGHRHGETLLSTLESFLAQREVKLADLTGVVVGTGPGAFTGLRVGIATAKGLAHALRAPIAGVSTAEALLAAASTADPGAPWALLLPAGPNDRILARRGEPPRLLPGGDEPDRLAGERLIALDLDGRAPAEALAAGGRLRGDGLAAAFLRIGRQRLAAGGGDNLATLVPEYVTLPRGVAAESGEVAWSRDPRWRSGSRPCA